MLQPGMLASPVTAIPPLLPIDHILINDGLTACSVTSFPVSGNDHRGLFVTLAGAR